ncbi:glucan biosynthesis protein [bacterium]|nr:glucan biosynthesis protein [bacterium]
MTNRDRRIFLQRSMVAGLMTSPSAGVLAQSDNKSSAADNADADASAQLDKKDNQADAFSYDWLVEEAQRRASSDYELRALDFTGDYSDLSYDQYRDIRFNADKDPLSENDSSFHMDLLPPGFLFNRKVNINLVEKGVATALPFSLDMFNFGELAPEPDNPDQLSYSGLRLRYPLNRSDVLDEVVVFQGASYFRAVARGLSYGLSARGLTVNTAEPSGEEFPVFTDFWIEPPSSSAPDIRVWALLDSVSVAGAFQFQIVPGAETVMEVQSTLFARTDINNVGVAPLTSMFLFNQSNRSGFDDYREAVHDSQGLQMISGKGERIWRSLGNPANLQVSSFSDINPTAFGLVQRHRAFTDYQDAEARYESRPSAWIQPVGDWGKGVVELVEIPSPIETNDNIVAFWRPAGGFKAGKSYRFDYRLSWNDIPGDTAPLFRVDAVRIGERPFATTREIIVDFDTNPAKGNSAPSTEDISIELSMTAGKHAGVRGQVLPGGSKYRVSFDFDPEDNDISDMRMVLRDDKVEVSEVWLYRWSV